MEQTFTILCEGDPSFTMTATCKGRIVTEGTYFYVMKYQEGKVITSWVYIEK